MFIESPRFPDDISLGLSGGAQFATEQAKQGKNLISNATRSIPLHTYDVTHGIRTEAQFAALNALFNVVQGKWGGFRFKDWTDYKLEQTSNTLGMLVAIGPGQYQLTKRYSYGGATLDRPITKPVAGTIVVARNAVTVIYGVAAGNIALDTTTGIVAFVPDSSETVSSVTVGASTVVALASVFSPVPTALTLHGLTGADAALLNDQSFAVTGISGTSYTLDVDTSGKTITTGGGSTALTYPEASEALTAVGEFDIAMKFDTDAMEASIDNKRANGQNLFTWARIVLIEWLNPS